MLTAFDLCLGACGVLLTLAGTAIDFVVDRLTGLVLLQRSWSLLRSEIAAVPIDLFLISGKKFRGHRNIMLVGSCHFYRMNQTTFFIYSDMGFIAKVPYLDCGRKGDSHDGVSVRHHAGLRDSYIHGAAVQPGCCALECPVCTQYIALHRYNAHHDRSV